MDNNEIFMEFWRTYKWPEVLPILFRVYHDDDGRILEYSHEDHEGRYIDIAASVFSLRDYNAKVKDGCLIPAAEPLPPKLNPAKQGTPCHPKDVTVVHDEVDCVYWRLQKNV